MGFPCRRRAHFLRRQPLDREIAPTALALFAIFFVIDGALLVGMVEDWTSMPTSTFILIGLNFLTKLGACALGGRHG